MSETTNEAKDPQNPEPPSTSAIQELVATGLSWAQYGLAIGRQSLQTSARTLETAATFLGQLSERLVARPEEPPKE